MGRLAAVGPRFEIDLQVIEGGSGTIRGILVETSQNTQTATVFTEPRRLLRVRLPSALRPGMVLRTPLGEIYIVAENGGSEMAEGTLWESYKLYHATQQVLWQRRGRSTDPVTLLEIDADPITMGTIWVAVEPTNRESIERRLHVFIEQAIFIAAADVHRDDILDGKPVIRSDRLLGVRVGVLS